MVSFQSLIQAASGPQRGFDLLDCHALSEVGIDEPGLDAATGGYDVVWFIDIALAVAAALIHLPIVEVRPASVVQAAAAAR